MRAYFLYLGNMETKCSICRSPNRDEVVELIKGGESHRKIALRFGFSRAAVNRHVANCLKMKRDATAEAKAEAKVRHTEITGDIDAAYERAVEMRTRAEEAGDSDAILKMTRIVTRLLSLRQRSMAKLPSDVVQSGGAPKRDLSRIRFGWVGAIPPGSEVSEESRRRWADYIPPGSDPAVIFNITYVDRKPQDWTRSKPAPVDAFAEFELPPSQLGDGKEV